jgi:hypothetical protein
MTARDELIASTIALVADGRTITAERIAALIDAIREAEAERDRMWDAIHEASDHNFLFSAMDTVHDDDVTLNDYAEAASSAIRGYMEMMK